MISLLQKIQKTGRTFTAVSVVTLLSASLPVSAFSQEGIVALEKRPKQQQSQQPKPPDTPPTPQKELPKPNTQETREKQEQFGETKPQEMTEREKRNLPAPGENPAPSSTEGTQQQEPTDAGAPNQIIEPLQLSPEVTHERVGVRTDQKQLLSLQDAIGMALQNNLDIEAYRQGVQIAQYNLFASKGVYDIVSGTDLYYRSQTFPVTSIFGGGDNSSSVTQKSLVYNFTTQQDIEKTGGLWQVELDNTRLTTSSTASTLPTQYSPTLTLTFTQPLLRNFSIDQNRRQIQLAKKSLDLSDSQFRQRVIEIINSVQRAYWDLVFAIRNEEIARDSVELTRTQLENNQKQVEAGTLAPIELRSTEAALEARKGDVIIALQNITTAENTLKGLLIKDANDQMWYSEIEPTDQPQFGQPNFNLDEATRLALTNRPELEQMRLQMQQKDVDIKFFENQTKPQVDFIGVYGDTGVAGTPSSSSLGTNVPSRFQGGYFQALNNLFSQDFRTYQFGVRVSFPWRNRTAEGNLGRTLAEARQLDARQRQLVQSVQIDVRNALQAVEATRQRFEAARAARVAAEAQLKGEEEKFRAGLSTNFFVLQRQNDLAVARGTEVRALTDYNKALADLQRVTGMTLVSNNVQVTALPGGSTK